MEETEREQIAQEKRALRAAMRERRAGLDEAYRRAADRNICAAVLAAPGYQAAETVFSYVSMPGEPDTRALILAAIRAGKRVCVPKCLDGGRMLAVRIQSLEELTPGALSIPEPRDLSKAVSPEEMDLILVPCVTACRDGRRLGHGAGYYDRFLAGAGGMKMCLCYGRMLSEEIPVTALDVPMDAVITETDAPEGPAADGMQGDRAKEEEK